ncbi:MAG: hypothetical protein O6947_08640, partial [Acidobacteria bacterium]|nr:hypothetical protein [Acidobacteriota bacterium]
MSIFPVRFDRIRPFLVLVICVSTNLWGAIDSREDMERVFDSFYRIGLNTETIYAADGFELRKDAMVFQFQEGNFFLMDPLEGEITGAYFIGK